VEGPAGSGKSALLAAVAGHAEAGGLRVLAARGSELERDLGFGAVRQLFEGAVGAAPSAEREELLAGAAAPAAWVVSAPVRPGAAAVGADGGFAVPHAVYWLATNLSLRGPLLLAIDDLHWVDAASLRSLTYLARRIADLHIALVVALRPDEPGTPVAVLDGLRTEPGATRITLRPLQPASVAAIVRAAIPDAGDELCSACFEASAGNPFYVRELLRAIAGDGRPEDAVWLVRQAAIPSVGDRVSRRIARLGPDAVALARAMAVLDDGGRLADAAAVAGLADEAAAAAAGRMRRIEVLGSEDPFAFVHPLVRRSVYDGLSIAERNASHQAAAVRLRERGASPEEVAAHLAAVRPAGSDAVVAALREAARHAMARAAPEAAIRWLTRALEEDAVEPSRAVLLHELGRVELFGRDPRAIEHLHAALALTDDPVLRARAALDMAEILVAAGRSEEAVTTATEALRELGSGAPELALEMRVFRDVSQAFDPRMVKAFNRDRAALRALAQGDSWPARALAVLLACTSAIRGEPASEVLALVEHGLRDGRLLAERGAGGWASVQAIMALVILEADARALEVIDEVAARARSAGALFGAMTALGFRGWVYSRGGDLAAAEAELAPLVEVGMQQGMPLLVANGVWFLSDALLERSSLDELAQVVLATEYEPRFLDTAGGAMGLEARGRLRLARGDHTGGLADLRACATTYDALGYGPRFTPWRAALALALPATEREEALALVDEEVVLATDTGQPRLRGVALRAAGLVEGDEEGLTCLRESVALLKDTPARLEHARSLVELGAALRRRGRRAQAREPLAAGMEVAHRCGAERLVARAGEELRAAGARPRRIARTGVDALTVSERRAARLAAEGRSNSEIAQELFVSLKTVETHLSHVYRKLGLTGPSPRRLLAETLERARR
jgi:DNA-binding CsgD family transcriptional regulator